LSKFEVEIGNYNGIHWLSVLLEHAFNGKALKHRIRSMGYQFPLNVTDMYLKGESSLYIAAAVMAVNQSGD
jgi:hypothetical protein